MPTIEVTLTDAELAALRSRKVTLRNLTAALFERSHIGSSNELHRAKEADRALSKVFVQLLGPLHADER